MWLVSFWISLFLFIFVLIKQFLQNKNVYRIQTWIIELEGENDNHSPTTTAFSLLMCLERALTFY